MEKQKRDRVWMAPLQTHHIRTPHDRQEAIEGQMKDRRLINGGLYNKKQTIRMSFVVTLGTTKAFEKQPSSYLLYNTLFRYIRKITIQKNDKRNVCKEEYLAGSFSDRLKIRNNTYSRTKCYKTNGNKDQQKYIYQFKTKVKKRCKSARDETTDLFKENKKKEEKLQGELVLYSPNLQNYRN